MRFEPKTEDQVKQGRLLVPGEWDFEVRDAKEETSEAGNEMIHLVLDCWDSNSDKSIVHCYLLDKLPHLVRHFAYSVGLGHVYEQGAIEADACIGKSGRCVGRTKPARGEYSAKNEIHDFVVADRTKETAAYQQAKAANTPPPKTTAQAMADLLKIKQREAWEAYQRQFAKEFPQATQAEVGEAWKKACAAYWPGKSIPGGIAALEWDRFRKDGFVRQPSPVVEAGEFKDEDIPF